MTQRVHACRRYSVDPRAHRRAHSDRDGHLVFACANVAAQPAERVARIGVLFPAAEQSWTASVARLREGLKELGWVEGRNLVLDFRYADDKYERLPALAAELVALKPDIIFAGSAPAIRAATKATRTIPIVVETLGDAVSAGLVPNLGRPGTNVTGVSGSSPELGAKRLQFLHELLPHATRIAVLANVPNPATPAVMRSLERGAKDLSLQLEVVDVRDPTQLEGAFAAMAQRKTDALVVVSDPMLFGHRQNTFDLAARYRLPTAFDVRQLPGNAGLMSYGPGPTERFLQVAEYIDRILRGARPADLPLARPTKFELVINRRTAESLGITVPPALLLRADEVIQ